MNLKLISLVALVVLTAACATAPEPLKPPEEIVAERSQARWDHLVAAEAEQAREYYTPGYRAITSVVDYEIWARTRPIRWLGAEVEESWCESEDLCRALVKVRYRIPGGPVGINTMRLEREVEEEWIQLEGQWFYVRK
ncbi:MAG: hypothetical protein AAGJ52_01915 [Pseudomonadota bacterium]